MAAAGEQQRALRRSPRVCVSVCVRLQRGWRNFAVHICFGFTETYNKGDLKYIDGKKNVLNYKEAVMECDFFFLVVRVTTFSLHCLACSAKQNAAPSRPPFVFPATLTDSTFPIGYSFKAFPSSFVTCSLTPHLPPSPWHTALCPSVCLLCRRSLIREKWTKQTPVVWLDQNQVSDWITGTNERGLNDTKYQSWM